MGNSNMPQRRGLAIGCGGTVGAEMVTMLAAGVSVDELVAMQRGTVADPVLIRHMAATPARFPPLPRPRLGAPRMALCGNSSRQSVLTAGSRLLPVGGGDADWLQRLAADLHAERARPEHPAAWLVAMDYDSGRRVAFGSPGAPSATVGEALRASWAVPGWFPPVSIGGRRYIDGGAASTASVDLLEPLALDELVVLTPMASARPIPARDPGHWLERRLRRPMSAQLDAEIAAIRAAGARVLHLAVTAGDLAVMGPNFMDGRRRAETFEHSLRSTRREMERSEFS